MGWFEPPNLSAFEWLVVGLLFVIAVEGWYIAGCLDRVLSGLRNIRRETEDAATDPSATD